MMMIATLFLGLSLSASAATHKISLKNGKGETVGTATISETTKGVKVKLDVKGLTPGEHGIHFHEKASCVGPKFESAGGHLNPKNMKHGFETAGGPHAGDMANVVAAQDGASKAEVMNTNLTMTDLKNGAALVIHEKPDDYKSQPAGDAGGRWACGEIK